MGSGPPVLTFLLTIFAGWVNRQQLIIIEYLQAENSMLRERLKGRRLRFSEAERALLARKAKAVGRTALLELGTIVTPDTLLRWHRQFVAAKWNFSHRRRPGRPTVMNVISALIVRMATENPSWGYTRIQGALANLGHRVGRGTVSNVLMRNGIEPAPQRGKRTSWATFLKSHWEVLAAGDFLSVEVWTRKGLVTHYLLFVINLADRLVHVAGITTNPAETWMLQVGRNMTDAIDGALLGKCYLILDRDTKYSPAFRKTIGESRTAVIRLPPRSLNLNAFAERFVRSIKEECLNRMIFVGQDALRRAVREYVAHYRGERNHQGLDNRLLMPIKRIGGQSGSVRKLERLGGLLNYYDRRAA
jgi:transposase InsO family protein